MREQRLVGAATGDGSSYRMRTRFHFQNVPELVKLFRTVADVQMAEPYGEASVQQAATTA